MMTLIPVWSQISSPTADYTDSLSYPVSFGKDPRFVFYQVNQVPKAGRLDATHPNPGSYNFEWRKYNPDLDGFDPPFVSESGAASSTVTDLIDGGYQVRIWNGSGTDTTMLAWVMLDHLTAECEKTADNKVKVESISRI